jgi:hypothetical protein
MRQLLYRLMLRMFPRRDEAGKTDWQWFKRFDITTDGNLYLRRFILAKTPWGGAYLHHIIRSDWDRCLHDHPWGFWTLMLRGGYWEETPATADVLNVRLDVALSQVTMEPLNDCRVRKWYGLGSGRYVPAYWMHRVLLKQRMAHPESSEMVEIPAWTLVFVQPKSRSWGFWQKGRWVHHREFADSSREC